MQFDGLSIWKMADKIRRTAVLIAFILSLLKGIEAPFFRICIFISGITDKFGIEKLNRSVKSLKGLKIQSTAQEIQTHLQKDIFVNDRSA